MLFLWACTFFLIVIFFWLPPIASTTNFFKWIFYTERFTKLNTIKYEKLLYAVFLAVLNGSTLYSWKNEKKKMNKREGIICQQQQFNFIIFFLKGRTRCLKIYSTFSGTAKHKKLCRIGKLSNRDLFHSLFIVNNIQYYGK